MLEGCSAEAALRWAAEHCADVDDDLKTLIRKGLATKDVPFRGGSAVASELPQSLVLPLGDGRDGIPLSPPDPCSLLPQSFSSRSPIT